MCITLVTDDNRAACETPAMLIRLVRDDEVFLAYTGTEALRMALLLHPHLMILDIGLPELNGWQVAEIVRQNATFKDTRIYALTGYGQPQDIQRSYDCGMNYHFVKPLDMDLFNKVLAGHGLA